MESDLLLKTAALALREQQANIDELETRISDYREKLAKLNDAIAIIDLAKRRGEDVSSTVAEKIATLLTSGQDLDAMKKLMEMSAPSAPFASLAERKQGTETATDRFTQLIIGS